MGGPEKNLFRKNASKMLFWPFQAILVKKNCMDACQIVKHLCVVILNPYTTIGLRSKKIPGIHINSLHFLSLIKAHYVI